MLWWKKYLDYKFKKNSICCFSFSSLTVNKSLLVLDCWSDRRSPVDLISSYFGLSVSEKVLHSLMSVR